jgi:chromosome segregation ATPase
MSEERLTRIDDRLDRVEGRLETIENNVAVLTTNVAVLTTSVAVLAADVGVLKTDVGVLKIDMTGLRNRLEEVDRHIGIRFEELVDRIKALGQDDAARLEMRRSFAEVRSELGTHAALDADAHHYFANSLREQAQRLTRLEARHEG